MWQLFKQCPVQIISTVDAFVGNILKIKIIPGAGELAPFKLPFSPEKSLLLIKDEIKTKANFEVYELKAGAGVCGFRRKMPEVLRLGRYL